MKMIHVAVLMCLSVLAPVQCQSDCKPEVKCTGETLTVAYNGAAISCGSNQPTSAVASVPKVSYSQGTQGDQFLLVMVDPDAPSANMAPPCGYYPHWVAEMQKGSGNELQSLGSDVLSYQGPTPPQNTGPHRYQFMLFPRPVGGIKQMVVSGMFSQGRDSNFQLQGFLQVHALNFDALLAKFEFKSEYGATVDSGTTIAVVTGTMKEGESGATSTTSWQSTCVSLVFTTAILIAKLLG